MPSRKSFQKALLDVGGLISVFAVLTAIVGVYVCVFQLWRLAKRSPKYFADCRYEFNEELEYREDLKKVAIGVTSIAVTLTVCLPFIVISGDLLRQLEAEARRMDPLAEARSLSRAGNPRQAGSSRSRADNDRRDRTRNVRLSGGTLVDGEEHEMQVRMPGLTHFQV